MKCLANPLRETESDQIEHTDNMEEKQKLEQLLVAVTTRTHQDVMNRWSNDKEQHT